MKLDLEWLKAIATVLSGIALFIGYFWISAPEDRQSAKDHKTNPFIVIGIPAAAAIVAWVLFFVRRDLGQKRR